MLILSVCVHDKTKTAQTKITKLGAGMDKRCGCGTICNESSRVLVHQLILDQKASRSQGHKVQKGVRVAVMSYALYRVPSL